MIAKWIPVFSSLEFVLCLLFYYFFQWLLLCCLLTVPMFSIVASTPEVRQCPFIGRYLVSEENTAIASKQLLEEKVTCDQQYQALLVGCGPEHTMEFHSQCSSEAVSGEYQEHYTNIITMIYGSE